MSMPCEICGDELIRDSVVPSYQEPGSYAIFRCDGCKTMVANPKTLLPEVYNAIYAVPGGPPGYDRNFQFARAVKRAREPLEYLASRQDAFWGVRRALPSRDQSRVLEIGSGLGYFTYALRRAGYDAVGIDVSREAVAKARAAFGDFFHAESAESFARVATATFDAIVMVEVIEHLEDPVALIADALRLLAPGGSIIMTTPNRSFYGSAAPWTTDLPPVHLWWFSEESIAAIAKRVGCSVSFVDFAEYSSRLPILYNYPSPRTPMLDERGRMARREAPAVSLARRMGILQEGYWIATRVAGPLLRQRSPRRPTLVASLKAGSS